MSEITTTTVQRIQTPAEITELHHVIESRWLKPQTQTAAP